MRTLIPLTVLALILWLLIGSWWYSQKCCQSTATAAAKTAAPTVAAPPTATRQLSIADAPRFSTTAADNLLFTNGGFDFNKPLSSDLSKSYGELATYLKANPNRVLQLTGLYGKDEHNTSLLSNMGLARAANLKQYLESIGINGKQINTDSYLLPNFALENGQLIGGIRYTFADAVVAPKPTPATAKADNDRLTEIEKNLQVNPIVLYFETAESSINVEEQSRQKFADLIYYLAQKPDKKAVVVGHTDNVGAANLNMKYGNERAEFAKNYMIKNGLSGSRINTSSKGETQPTAPNTTLEGRAKNRRAEVTIQ